MSRAGIAAVLFVVLATGAALRFTGLAWGLRHPPGIDELFFVQNVGSMLARRDLNHGFYEYPGLFPYLLAPVLAFFDPPRMGAGAYLASRAVVAGFGVLSLGLVYVLGRRIAGPRAGLLAAALLAVSPVEVETAHMVRPDVVLESFVLLAFLAFRGVGEAARGDRLSALGIGAATAVKFSGALLVPSYLVRRLLSPGPRARRVLLAGALSVATFAVLSPYTLLDPYHSLLGMRIQLAYHYVPDARAAGLLGTVAIYLRALGRALGWPGVVLAAVGAGIGLRRRVAEVLPLVVFALVTVGVFSTATVHEERFLVPALGVIAVLAGLAADVAGEWRPWLPLALAAVVLAPPLAGSLLYVRAISRPCTRDQATEWIETHLPSGSRVVTTLTADVGLDPSRFEVLRVERFDQETWPLAFEAAAVAAGPGDEHRTIREMDRLFTASPETRWSGAKLRVLAVPPARRPRYRPLDLKAARLQASEAPEALGLLQDGDPATAWRTGERAVGAWLRVDFPRPVTLVRLEIVPGPDVGQAGCRCRVLVTAEGEGPTRAQGLEGRPRPSAQLPPLSEVLILPPRRAVSLEIVQAGAMPGPWAVGELRLWELE